MLSGRGPGLNGDTLAWCLDPLFVPVPVGALLGHMQGQPDRSVHVSGESPTCDSKGAGFPRISTLRGEAQGR